MWATTICNFFWLSMLSPLCNIFVVFVDVKKTSDKASFVCSFTSVICPVLFVSFSIVNILII